MKKLIIPIFLILSVCLQAKDIDLKKAGAKADGKTKITAKLQKAIDEVSNAGGGRVILSGGKFVTAPISLKSGVELYIDADATLLASPDLEDYPERTGVKHLAPNDSLPRWRNVSLIFADGAENIAITGRGTIDCNGHLFVKRNENPKAVIPWERTVEPRKTIARVVVFAGCKNVQVRDVTMQNQPAGWSYWVNDCQWVNFDCVKILAAVDYPNNDGIHINCSCDVTVSNSFIQTGDDAVVIRANSRTINETKSCERIVITNCTLRSWCMGIRFGWTNDGVMKNCTFSNLVLHDCSCGFGFSFIAKGVKNDWGYEASLVENMNFSNIQMTGITGIPVLINVKGNKSVLFDAVRNLRFDNMHCEARCFPYIRGLKDRPIEDIIFSNCSFTRIPESSLPDWRHHNMGSKWENTGLYLEHTKGIRFINTEFNTL